MSKADERRANEIDEIIARAREFQRELCAWEGEIARCPWCDSDRVSISFTTHKGVYFFFVKCWMCGAAGPELRDKGSAVWAWAWAGYQPSLEPLIESAGGE